MTRLRQNPCRVCSRTEYENDLVSQQGASISFKISDRRAAFALALAACVLGACAAVAPGRLAAGTPVADVVRGLGPASFEYALPNAAKRLEYTGGTYGKQTWMLDFNAAGLLTGNAQVRMENRFNQVLVGMSRDDVLLRLGHPSETSVLSFQKQTVWSYRFEGPFCVWFQVGLGVDGRVADTGYLPDPICEPQGFDN